ncbi:MULTISPECIES: conjugative transfer ATPase [Pseudomonas syringae group]|uniref:Type IV secretory pathway VirB4 component n=2 Tax=Pseudomonas syringae TaxID=317 RepID=M1J684_PSESF|nr:MULTISPECIES: conjugative transfer ATPase [Pseudomonas syringae group]AGE82319.1 type IV secretory pathway VirB4 component [Pseudomonas syringae pv. actinidiae]AGE82445.1 type IV secretory pathway VirB4 component [Pseudomonas syringae pv. actinidiae]AQX58238.1 conjugative transfer ATPase, PFL_4706 family [Pseudomonas syringae pv. actinidiae]AQX64132.1 conjugative transfer ATPase, PFL_4706 family [Pseudomonas syringae pv. actinidiae]AYL80037.1 conjugative transfer ATPase [Pseudomonas syringa
MNFFERLTARARSSSSTVSDAAEEHPLIANPTADGDPQVADATTESLKATDQTDVDAALERYLKRLEDQGIPAPGDWRNPKKKPATVADVAALYDVKPSFVDLLPWTEYLPEEQAMLLEDGKSLAAFFELTPIGTEGRDPEWLRKVRDALENALQNSFDELDTSPWVVQFYAKDETSWDDYLQSLTEYIRPQARNSAFSEMYLSLFKHHLDAIAKPGGLFEDTTVSKLPWRGQQRRVRVVLYRRVVGDAAFRGQSPAMHLNNICQRFTGGLANAGIKCKRMDGYEIRHWLLRWFNPHPDHLGTTLKDFDRFFHLVNKRTEEAGEELPLVTGDDFAQGLFYREPKSDSQKGLWYFDGQPHRVIMLDRLREAPRTGHLTGETRMGGDALHALFDKLPEDTVLTITLVITPQDVLEAHLEKLARKSVGDNTASAMTREAVDNARKLIGREHKLYRGSVAFYLKGRDEAQLTSRSMQLTNALLSAGMEPVASDDEVAPLNSYLRWLPGNFDVTQKRAMDWYVQMMLVQHVANLCPVWGRSSGTGHPGITLFNRGGAPLTFDPLNKLDRQMNAHMFLFGPTGAGKSATLNNLLNQLIAVYAPRLFIVEAGNSFGLLGDFAKKLGMTVNRIKLAPNSGVSLAPFADAIRLVTTPSQVTTLDADDLERSDEHLSAKPDSDQEDDERDVLGEMEIVARLMITGGEEKEEARLTRADRSVIRHCILAAARTCSDAERTVLTEDVRNALRAAGEDTSIPEARRNRMLEMAEAMDMFCMGADGEMFNRPGTPWPEADLTIVDLATYAREGYNAQLSIAYISLINTVNNIAERDQYKGRPLVNVTDEGHIITKNPLLSPYIIKITKMWRKLGAWFWLATQNIDDLPPAAAPMLNMIEWWICLNMPPDEVEKISRFRELTPAQKSLMLSARKESGKYTEGVVLSKSMEVLFRAVPPSLYLALAMTEPEEKKQRYDLMQSLAVDELEAALEVAADLDRKRGIEPLKINFPTPHALENLA